MDFIANLDFMVFEHEQNNYEDYLKNLIQSMHEVTNAWELSNYHVIDNKIAKLSLKQECDYFLGDNPKIDYGEL